jgi:hypothetical protein
MGSTDLTQILRILLGLVGGVLFLLGVILILAGGPAAAVGFWPVVIGLVLLMVALYERSRYQIRPPQDAAGPSRFRPTEEVFTDPTTGQLTRVWFDAQTGEREYRPER